MRIEQKNSFEGIVNFLPASKSIANRVLVIDALSGGKSKLHNISDANDTQLMTRLLGSNEYVIDVEDAGTTMRFLTAFFAITNQDKVLTGTARMKERPIGLLVDALRSLGASITYTEKEGYPPLRVHGFSGQLRRDIDIRGDVSSQFISALMMVAPLLPQGLQLNLLGKIGSRPYIEMTASLMNAFGASADFHGSRVSIAHQAYKPIEFTIESDWSAASYWFAFVALASNATVYLPRIFDQSLQGDRAIIDIMKHLGVSAHMVHNRLQLIKSSPSHYLRWDFSNCPDLAQTVAVVCAAKGIKATFTGLESLRIKETDRIDALQKELAKIGANLREDSGAAWTLIPAHELPGEATFSTYKDHRMAMAFAPLATLMDVNIENPQVVKKSYPRFWDDIESFGFTVNRIEAI